MLLRTASLPMLLLSLASVHAQVTGNGSCGCWTEPDSTWTFLGSPGFGNVQWNTGYEFPFGQFHGPMALPFPFIFYGQAKDSLYINSNGTISFEEPVPVQLPINFPYTGEAMLAGFWSHVDLRIPPFNPPSGVHGVAYKLTPTALYVSWENVPYYLGNTYPQFDQLNSFQMILSNGSDPAVPDGNNVLYCYRDMQWAVADDSEGAADGFGGTNPANVGANSGDGFYGMQAGRFAYPDSAWNGSIPWSGVAWLNGRYMAFNTAPLNVPPFFSSTGCDTVEVHVGETGHYPIVAHKGGPAPPLTVFSICSTLSNYAVTDQAVDGSHVLTATFTPTANEVGLHAMHFQATAGIAPSSTTVRYVKVLDAMGVDEGSEGPALSIFPNPASGTVKLTWHDPAPRVVQLIDGRGWTVLQARSADADMQLSVEDLPVGIYMVRAVSPGSTAVGRLLVAGH